MKPRFLAKGVSEIGCALGRDSEGLINNNNNNSSGNNNNCLHSCDLDCSYSFLRSHSEYFSHK